MPNVEKPVQLDKLVRLTKKNISTQVLYLGESRKLHINNTRSTPPALLSKTG
jgi:hypothetical protein